jgi:hypothetical protein
MSNVQCGNGRLSGGVRGVARNLVCAAVVLCFAAVGRAEEGRGRIAFAGTNTVALGEYPNYEDRTGRVRVTNAGDGPLGITRVLTTCACLRVDGFPRSLKPGETGEVAVAITKYGVAGAFELSTR